MKSVSSISLHLALISALLSCCYGSVVKDEILSLPGWKGKLSSKQYSGYLDVNENSHLHYWFVESESNPSTDPVVLWLNGGPGCSSLDGFFYEQGPFEFSSTGELRLRDYRWNRVANMLFLEAPVGVGFSYNDLSNYNNTDDSAALDNRNAVEQFFKLFPEYLDNPFYITGESYAGIYVPTLAEAILNGVDDGTYTGAQLLGIGVGNGCTGYEVGVCGFYFGDSCKGLYYFFKYLLDLSFVSSETKMAIERNCDWEACKAAERMGGGGLLTDVLSPRCFSLLDTVSKDFAGVNIYNVYGSCKFDSCAGPDDNQVVGKVGAVGMSTPMDSRSALSRRLSQIAEKAHSSIVNSPYIEDSTDDDLTPRGPYGCIDSGAATKFLMNPEVQKAIHVKDPGYCWASCNQASGFRYESTRPNIPRDTYPRLVNRIKVLIYNGDWDACVPYTDNQGWTEEMGFEIESPWKPWEYTAADNSSQIGGYSVSYVVGGNGWFEFRTVRGAGHMVPGDAPAQGLAVLSYLLGINERHVYADTNDGESSSSCEPEEHHHHPAAILLPIAIILFAAGTIFYLLYELKNLRNSPANSRSAPMDASNGTVLTAEMVSTNGGRNSSSSTNNPLSYARVNVQDDDTSSSNL